MPHMARCPLTAQICTQPIPTPTSTPTPTVTPTSTPTPKPTPASGASFAPAWKILILIYQNTDFAFKDSSSVQRRVVASMTQEKMDIASTAARRFFEEDVLQLDSGYMRPTVTIRYPQRTLNQLEPYWGYWPSRMNTAPELDPAFDSVVVIWESAGVDINNNQSYNLANACGLTSPNGTGQTYSTIPVFCIRSNDRNVFKHEWGHSILFYFAAAGTAPKPAADNHINNDSNQYVHYSTGESYILQDETDDNPIPNSIYNNQRGFTHDYYSGTTARPSDPTRYLGITQSAWASGGPVSRPTPPPTPTPTP